MNFWEWIILVFAGLAFLTLVIVIAPPLHKKIYKARFKHRCYKSVRKVALYSDYYLINSLILPLDNQTTATMDHVLFGEKFIYVIVDRFYQGRIKGKAEDDRWLNTLTNKRKKGPQAFQVDNPLVFNRVRIEKLALITGLEEDFIISIVLTNDTIDLSEIKIDSKTDYIIHRKQLAPLVKAIETRPVNKLKAEPLHNAVQDIARLNKRDLRKKGK